MMHRIIHMYNISMHIHICLLMTFFEAVLGVFRRVPVSVVSDGHMWFVSDIVSIE